MSYCEHGHPFPVQTPKSCARSLSRQTSTGVSIGGRDSLTECQIPQPNHALQRTAAPLVSSTAVCNSFVIVPFLRLAVAALGSLGRLLLFTSFHHWSSIRGDACATVYSSQQSRHASNPPHSPVWSCGTGSPSYIGMPCLHPYMNLPQTTHSLSVGQMSITSGPTTRCCTTAGALASSDVLFSAFTVRVLAAAAELAHSLRFSACHRIAPRCAAFAV